MHLDEECLDVFGEVTTGPVFFFELVAPSFGGKLFEFFEDFGRGFLREDFFAACFADVAIGTFAFVNLDADKAFLTATP